MHLCMHISVHGSVQSMVHSPWSRFYTNPPALLIDRKCKIILGGLNNVKSGLWTLDWTGLQPPIFTVLLEWSLSKTYPSVARTSGLETLITCANPQNL